MHTAQNLWKTLSIDEMIFNFVCFVTRIFREKHISDLSFKKTEFEHIVTNRLFDMTK